MATNVIDRYRRWFEYEQDAHAKVLASFETVPPDRRESSEFRRAVAILSMSSPRVACGLRGLV